MKKININVPEDLLWMIDDEARRKHMTRTAYILSACQQAMEKDQFLRTQPIIQRKLTELNEAISELASTGENNSDVMRGQERMKF